MTTTLLEPPESPPVPPAVTIGASKRRRRPSTGIELGLATLYLSFVVVIPLAAVIWRGTGLGWSGFWAAVTTPEARYALTLTVVASLIVAAVNAVMGTLIAWVIVRDHFVGKRLLDALIDLPFALPTIVAGLVLLALYGPDSPVHVTLAFTQLGVVVSLLFVTLPFVVRTVQPVLLELDRDMEQAAASLGASRLTIFRRVILPNLVPGDPGRHSAVVRPRPQRVRLDRAHLGEPADEDRRSPRCRSSTRSRTTTRVAPPRCRRCCCSSR